MNTKPDYFGSGPRIARIFLPYLVIAVVVTLLFPSIFTFGEAMRIPLLISGAILLVIGLIVYATSGKRMTRAVRNAQLVTTGPYRYCRNPLYTSVILALIPGVALMLNSWLVLTASLVGYIAFSRCIGSEDRQMEERFGEAYRVYRNTTSGFFPLPPKRN